MPISDRYARHRLIDGWDQDKISVAKIMVVGAGAIGNEVIKLLALYGIGHVLIVDFDTVELSNLSRSLLFRESDIGRPKSEVAAERARELNPDIGVYGLHGDVQFDVGLGVIRSMDLVIGGLDSLDARLALNRSCLHVGKPWLNGGIEASVAEVSLFGSNGGACFECGMSDDMWRRRSERFSCGGLLSTQSEAVAPTTAVVASLAAAYLVQEAMHLIHAGEDAVLGKKSGLQFSQKVTVNLDPYHTEVYSLPANPDCLAHEAKLDAEIRAETPSSTTVSDLLRWAGCADGAVELGFDLLTKMQCVTCGESQSYCVPLARCGADIESCPKCNIDSRTASTINWIDREHPLAHVALSELSIPDHQIVCVKNSDDRRYYQLGGASLWKGWRADR